MWSDTDGSLVAKLVHPCITAIVCHPCVPLIVVGTSSGHLELFVVRATTIDCVGRSALHPGSVDAVTLDPAAMRIVSVGGGFLAVAALAPSLAVSAQVDAPTGVRSIVCCPDGSNSSTVVMLSGPAGKATHVTVISLPNSIEPAHILPSLALQPAVAQRRTFTIAADVSSACVTGTTLYAHATTHRSLLKADLIAAPGRLAFTTHASHLVRGVGSVHLVGPALGLVSSGADGRVVVLDPTSLRLLSALAVHNGGSTLSCQSADGTKYVS